MYSTIVVLTFVNDYYRVKYRKKKTVCKYDVIDVELINNIQNNYYDTSGNEFLLAW